jgi:uncharacterized protein (TIGR03437 family)
VNLVVMIAAAGTAAAQQVTLSLDSGGAAAGASLSLNLSLAAVNGAEPSVAQWTVQYEPSWIAAATVTAGTSATTADKALSCVNGADRVSCVAFGLNQTVLSDGVLAVVTFTLAAGAPAGSTPVQVNGVGAAASDSTPIPGTGSGGSIAITTVVLPAVSGFACTPASVTAPGSSACTITLDLAAPGGGFTVITASSNAAVSVPASVTVAEGATSAGFTATVAAVSSDQTANLTAGGRSFLLSIVAPRYSISGVVSPSTSGSGTTLTLTGASSATVLADSAGAFGFTGLLNGGYTITPAKSGYTFTPASHSVTVSDADVTGVAFTAAQVQSYLTPAYDVTVWKDQSTAGTVITSPVFSTTEGGELLLAFIAAGWDRGSNAMVTGVTGAGLTWVPVVRARERKGTSEIWRAFAWQRLVNVSVTATLSDRSTSSLTIASFRNIDTSGVNGAGAIGQVDRESRSSGAPKASLVTTRDNSLVVGVGNDPDGATPRGVPAGQSLIHQYLAPDRNTYWVQKRDAAVPRSGTLVYINDVSPTNHAWNLAIAEIRGAPASTQTSSSLPRPGAAARTRGGLEISNPAGGFAGPVCSPGGLAAVHGEGLTWREAEAAASFPWPERLAGVSVKVNGAAAPLLFASASEVRFQCPGLAAESRLEIAVENESGDAVASVESVMQAAAPGIFTLEDADQGAVVVLETGELAASRGGRTARRGERVSIYAGGLGETLDGVVRNAIRVVVGEVEVEPELAVLTPGTAGLYRIDVRLPEYIPAGAAVPLSLRVTVPGGAVVESNQAVIAVAGR